MELINIQKIFDDYLEEFLKNLLLANKYNKEFSHIKKINHPPEPKWGQDWFPRLDAVMLYTFLREKNPEQYIEVGSGHSTRFARKAILDGNLQTKLCSIDPQPRTDLKDVFAEKHRVPLQEVTLDRFKSLKKSDIIFIDSSHKYDSGSDVYFFIHEIFPLLPSGIMIHFHDIFLPDPYPKEWEWRQYNEQEIVGKLILEKKLIPIFSSYYLTNISKSVINKFFIREIFIKETALENSLWVQKV